MKDEKDEPDRVGRGRVEAVSICTGLG